MMEDIELVIKIPEGVYQHYKKVWQKRRGSIPESCIAWGTPLPKGHGRLKDVDEIERLLDLDKPDNAIAKVLKNIIESVPTIIEADKRKSEDKE